MGLTSLTVDYGQVSTACLVRAIDDGDRLGLVTSALLDIQRSSDRGNAAVEQISDEETRFYTGLRQLCIMEQHGVHLTKQGEAYEATPHRSPGKANQDDGKLAALLRSSLGFLPCGYLGGDLSPRRRQEGLGRLPPGAAQYGDGAGLRLGVGVRSFLLLGLHALLLSAAVMG